LGWLLMTRETVLTDTPAAAATSWIVADLDESRTRFMARIICCL
jgi:hypothetical protein